MLWLASHRPWTHHRPWPQGPAAWRTRQSRAADTVQASTIASKAAASSEKSMASGADGTRLGGNYEKDCGSDLISFLFLFPPIAPLVPPASGWVQQPPASLPLNPISPGVWHLALAGNRNGITKEEECATTQASHQKVWSAQAVLFDSLAYMPSAQHSLVVTQLSIRGAQTTAPETGASSSWRPAPAEAASSS